MKSTKQMKQVKISNLNRGDMFVDIATGKVMAAVDFEDQMVEVEDIHGKRYAWPAGTLVKIESND